MDKVSQNLIEIRDKSIREGFVILPRKIIRARGLSIQAKLVYGLLLDYAWQKKECFPGQERMGKDLGLHRNTIRKYIDELQAYGLVEKHRRPNSSNKYILISLEDVENLNSQFSLAQGNVRPVAQIFMQPSAQSSVQELETINYKKNKYKQSLTLNGKANNSFFKQIPKRKNYKELHAERNRQLAALKALEREEGLDGD